MAIEIISTDQISLTEQAELFTAAFDGYIGGSFQMDAAGLSRLLSAQDVDLCHSRFARDQNGLCGFAFLTRSGNVSRICGMGLHPRFRGSQFLMKTELQG